ncbi:M15 family metallopeptidase [Lentzea sp. DG1S-22]|uniref:M15 family metallopeptidase n=1 Tax=Lentzea sp. DG1S-22 TaxID=3108822 RepID=UPI002E75A461|nr:M15 family metallopeptidase [Lentzea sp. DG1S-22]WVH81757.1 M15 family metallopeptidase [Lentzea sp. DG1S-22]
MAAFVLAVAACAPGADPSPIGTTEDGRIPENESISLDDSGHAALANLDPALLVAVRAAAADAAVRGVELKVTSGWRSREYQQRLLDEAVARHRSEEEARKLVHPPDRSRHVTGQAIDIGPTNAADWLIQHGADYGLCQAYANEMWHFELLTTPGGDCPQPQGSASG